jgi:hypothetical protein
MSTISVRLRGLRDMRRSLSCRQLYWRRCDSAKYCHRPICGQEVGDTENLQVSKHSTSSTLLPLLERTLRLDDALVSSPPEWTSKVGCYCCPVFAGASGGLPKLSASTQMLVKADEDEEAAYFGVPHASEVLLGGVPSAWGRRLRPRWHQYPHQGLRQRR